MAAEFNKDVGNDAAETMASMTSKRRIREAVADKYQNAPKDGNVDNAVDDV